MSGTRDPSLPITAEGIKDMLDDAVLRKGVVRPLLDAVPVSKPLKVVRTCRKHFAEILPEDIDPADVDADGYLKGLCPQCLMGE